MGSENKIAAERIAELLGLAIFEVCTVGKKTTVATAVLPNGFVITESSSCVDPANYSQSLGEELCRDRIENKLWELEGYRLQCELAATHGDFMERVVLERKELNEKIEALNDFFQMELFEGLPNEERRRLFAQERHMVAYAQVLSDRIEHFSKS